MLKGNTERKSSKVRKIEAAYIAAHGNQRPNTALNLLIYQLLCKDTSISRDWGRRKSCKAGVERLKYGEEPKALNCAIPPPMGDLKRCVTSYLTSAVIRESEIHPASVNCRHHSSLLQQFPTSVLLCRVLRTPHSPKSPPSPHHDTPHATTSFSRLFIFGIRL